MNAIRKFAGALLSVAIIGLAGCSTVPDHRPEIKLPDMPNKGEILAKKSWYVNPEIKYYDLNRFVEVVRDGPKGELLHFTRHFPRLATPPASTVAIANIVMADFKKSMKANGFNVVDKPCNSCLTVEIEFGHYEGEETRFIFFIPISQEVMYLMARARVFSGKEMVMETSDTGGRKQFKGLAEKKSNQEALAAKEVAYYVVKQITTLATNNRQRLSAAQ